mgnify:CR=1 FL=1
MSTNRVYAAKLPAIARPVPAGTRAGDFLVVNGRPVVALTDREGSTKTETLGDLEIKFPSGGASLKAGEASLNVDGTYDLPVTGADDDTENDAPVYIEGDELTLTKPAADEVIFGYTNYPPDNYARKAGIAPVRIGA